MTRLGFGRRDGEPPRIWGHRGVRGAAPENTMAAFERAAAEGADGVELDVRLSSDGVVVVAHDPELSRVSGGVDTRAVADVSSSDLERVDLGEGQGVPRLTDVLRLAQARGLMVNVEVKRDVPDRRALVRTVADVLGIWPDARTTIMLSTFDPAMLLELRLRARGLLVAMLVHAGQRRYHPWHVAGALAAAIHPERLLVTSDDVRRARRTGHVTNVWTVNDPTEARDLAAAGVDGLITDVPGLIGAAVRGLRDPAPVVFLVQWVASLPTTRSPARTRGWVRRSTESTGLGPSSASVEWGSSTRPSICFSDVPSPSRSSIRGTPTRTPALPDS